MFYALLIILLATLIVVMFLLADDIRDMREELDLLNKRSDQLTYGDVPTMPSELSRGE